MKLRQSGDVIMASFLGLLQCDAADRSSQRGHHAGVLFEAVVFGAGLAFDARHLDRLVHEPDGQEVVRELAGRPTTGPTSSTSWPSSVSSCAAASTARVASG